MGKRLPMKKKGREILPKGFVRPLKGGYLFIEKRSGIAQQGLYAGEDIPKGVFVIEYGGKVFRNETDADTTGGRYLFEVNTRRYLDGNYKSNPARFINHACRPNCEAINQRGRVKIYSIKNIKKGEELTYNYGKSYFNEFIKPRGCRCLICRLK